MSQKIGRFQKGEEIGKGAAARVYKGFDPEIGNFVAIKQVALQDMTEDRIQSFETEKNLLKSLSHPNIVQYKDFIFTEQHLNIIIEYCDGGSLANIIKKYGKLEEPLAAKYTLQIIKGLQYLHENNVVHRDIKGANILLSKDNTVKLADFGVAKKLKPDEATSTCVGTPF